MLILILGFRYKLDRFTFWNYPLTNDKDNFISFSDTITTGRANFRIFKVHRIHLNDLRILLTIDCLQIMKNCIDHKIFRITWMGRLMLAYFEKWLKYWLNNFEHQLLHKLNKVKVDRYYTSVSTYYIILRRQQIISYTTYVT